MYASYLMHSTGKINLILIIDDEPSFFHLLEGMLSGYDLQLHYVRESVKALDAIREIQPKVILTDLMMPKKSGLELCREIKECSELKHIPIILLTALEDENLLGKCLEAGADDFLNKHVSESELKARIRSMLRIRHQYDELRSSIQLREDVAHMIVHDLGSPLATIMLEVEELLINEIIPGQKFSLEKIRNNTRRLHAMSHDMLMLAKMEHGKLRLDLGGNKLVVSINEAIDNLSSQAKRRKIDVRFLPSTFDTIIHYDANLILRVLENILSNAIKFSPSSSKIEVEILSQESSEGRRCQVQIKDQGPGVPEALKEKVFEKFEVVKMDQQSPQMGLGLAFCRMAIEAHGGSIGVRPNSPSGSIFWFEL